MNIIKRPAFRCLQQVQTRSTVLLLMMLLLLPLVTRGQAIKGTKKPRFELTETTLRDWKEKLEWSLQKDASPGMLSWYNAISYATAMNKVRYGGYRDWRVPSREELLSLADYARSAGFNGTEGHEVYAGLRQAGLANMQDEHYWTHTDDLYNDRYAWAVDMKTGLSETVAKGLYENVVVVRTLK